MKIIGEILSEHKDLVISTFKELAINVEFTSIDKIGDAKPISLCKQSTVALTEKK